MQWLKSLALTQYHYEVCRLVETQEEAATLSLVDNLDEQALLESVLDDFKPSYRAGTSARHYLIKTPFRYPPLKHGSRFGTRAMRSFFYASEDETTCLTEAAFYRFVFCAGKATPFSQTIQSEHSLFFVEVKTDKAADLTKVNDDDIQLRLRDPVHYQFTQTVGAMLRNQNCELIRYCSARATGGVNVAIDQADCIKSESPLNMKAITCETDSQTGVVRFLPKRALPIKFKREAFLVNGILPYPPT